MREIKNYFTNFFYNLFQLGNMWTRIYLQSVLTMVGLSLFYVAIGALLALGVVLLAFIVKIGFYESLEFLVNSFFM